MSALQTFIMDVDRLNYAPVRLKMLNAVPGGGRLTHRRVSQGCVSLCGRTSIEDASGSQSSGVGFISDECRNTENNEPQDEAITA